jgi:predicted phage-related endonuclease
MLAIAEEIEVEQNTDEWFDIRRPLVTSSELNNVLMDESKAGYKNYHAQKVLEISTGTTPERFKGNKYTDWGHDTEDLAATMYALETGNDIRTCGIFVHKWLKLGDSPDRIVTNQPGCVEIKAKKSANHLIMLKTHKLPNEYKAQVQNHTQMTNSEWCDFVSFDPDFPLNAQLVIIRVYRDSDYCKRLLLETSLFMDEVEKDVKFIEEYEGEIYGIRKI